MAEPSRRVVAQREPVPLFSRRARPRIRRRLRVIALGLVLLPTLALLFLVRAVVESDHDARLRDQQERQQALERRARGLAGQLGGQPELFPTESREYFSLLGAAPPIELAGPAHIDGSCSDWTPADRADATPCEAGLLHFDRADSSGADGYDPRDLSFSLLTGTRARQLYLFLRVFDDELRFRERHLDEGDRLHLVASLPGPEGASVPLRFLVALEPGPDGGVTTYQVDRSWSQQVPAETRLDWGNYQLSPSRRPYGRWLGTPEGYDIELRLPLASLGARWREAELGLAVVDVDQRGGEPGGLRRQTIWVLPRRQGTFAPEAPDARVFRRAWREAAPSSGHRKLAVFDSRGRELYASFAPEPETRDRVLELLDPWTRGTSSAPSHSDAGLAALRVVSDDDRPLGFVVEVDASPVSRPGLGAIVPQTSTTAAILAGALLLLFLLLAYTRRLSRRILALVDDVGGDRDADDEIGELSRRLSELIERDRAQRDYLEQLPRVLAHETSNPLGVVKMFMDDLAEPDPTERKRRHDSARRAIHSIEDLIEDLREATSLEEALERGERIDVDLIEHLADYASAYLDLNRVELELDLPAGRFRTRVIEGRIEQLLDKLLDNAEDFSDGSPVKIAAEVGESEVRIRVENTGPPLPEGAAAEQLFAPMRSGRKRSSERHLGLGLYVARLIAEHHGGGIRAWNADTSRVVFEVAIRSADGG